MLEAMGQAPTEDELFTMISEVDENMSGSIDFGEVSLHETTLFNVFHFFQHSYYYITITLLHYLQLLHSLSKLWKLKRSELRISTMRMTWLMHTLPVVETRIRVVVSEGKQ